MAAPGEHTIRRQSLHVDVEGTESQALELQAALPALCRNRITPALEGVLQRCDPQGHLLIERLELDVGHLAAEHLEERLPDAVAEALEKQLRTMVRLTACDEPAPAERDNYRTAEEALLHAFQHFLRTGTLPWWYSVPENQELEELLLNLFHAGPRAIPPGAADLLRAEFAETSSRQRLVRQFSPFFLATLLVFLAPQHAPVHTDLLVAVRQIGASGARDALEQELWQAAFAIIAAHRPFTARRLLDEARRRLSPPVRSELEAEIRRIRRMGRHGRAGGGREVMAGNLEVMEVVLDERETSPPTEGTASAERKALAAADLPTGEEPDLSEGIYVENAGLVLLHPFLPRFFEKLSLAADDRLLEPERAACLLQHLATGMLLTPEYRIPLCKVLCGLPLQAPVQADAALTEAERQEALALLEAVIEHWGALGNTSPDALRGTYLLRPGKISQRDDGDWLLQVEPQTCDILLEQLPWGISMLKLPWMKRMFWVEWR